MKNLKMLVLVTIICLLVIVLAQNAESINANFLFWEFSTSAFIMYLIFYVAGVVSALFGSVWFRKRG